MKNLQLLSSKLLLPYLELGRTPLIAVVGNAGVSKEDSKRIDKADIVVRFNNYATRTNITHTTDKFKCDVLFSTFDLHSQGSQPKDVVIGIPFPFKAKEISAKPNRWYPNARPWMVNPYENMRMCEELNIDSLGASHPLPSVGFTALWHMKDWHANFFICGYEWYYSDDTGLFQGWGLKNKDYPKSWNHNYPKEVDWVYKNMYEKININFSARSEYILRVYGSKV